MTTDPGGVTGEPVDLDRIADALEGAGDRLKERNDHIAAMGDAVVALTLSTDALVIAVKGNTQRNRQFRWTITLLLVTVLVAVGTAIGILLRLNSIAHSNHATNTTVLSCVDPAGKCYRDGQARTAAAVGILQADIVRDAAAAAVCAQKTSDYQRVVACIQRATASP